MMSDEMGQAIVIWWCIFAVWAIVVFFLFRWLGRWRTRVPDLPFRYSIEDGMLRITTLRGFVTLVRIPKERTTSAQVVGPFHWRLLNPLVLHLRSHSLRKVVIIRTASRLSYAVSPDDPEAFLNGLGLRS